MSKFRLLESFLLLSSGEERYLQQQGPAIPDYTSPPLPIALEATPEAYRSDDVIDSIRTIAGAGNCTESNRCHIPFPTPAESVADDNASKIGVVFYPGGLVDPRGYSVIADLLANRYGFPTVIPIFAGDVAFGFGRSCVTGRLDFAKAEFPTVEKWILTGHSFGGIAAMADLWSSIEANDESAAGLVMLASTVRGDVGCGDIDFSNVDIPMASVTGSVDEILNVSVWEANKRLLSNATQFVDIYGGNHRLFGAYNDSERLEQLGQMDGVPLIASEVQWDIVVSSIASVASRLGVPMPVRNEISPTQAPDSSEDGCPPIDSGASDIRVASWSLAMATLFVAVVWK